MNNLNRLHQHDSFSVCVRVSALLLFILLYDLHERCYISCFAQYDHQVALSSYFTVDGFPLSRSHSDPSLENLSHTNETPFLRVCVSLFQGVTVHTHAYSLTL